MSQSYYSYCGTPLHLLLDDEFATNYNNAVLALLAAQVKILEETGSPWEPTTPLDILWSHAEMTAFNNFGRIINLLVELAGGGLEIGQEDMTDDLLIKL